MQNPEGDPTGSFPEYSAGAKAAADYVNAELGGLGGHPIKIDLCKMVIAPDDSQRCANELAANKVDLVLSTLNYFGNHFSIYQAAGIPVIVGTAVTIADFTTKGVYAIGNGGGCVGSLTGMVQFATDQLEPLENIDVERVAIPWSDTPPGVVCYNDLTAKPLDVLNGTESGASDRADKKPGLKYIGVPFKPTTPDVTPEAIKILDFKPDVILYAGSPPDCWNLVDALGRVGWTPQKATLVMSSGCVDFAAMRAAGALAKGVYFVGSSNGLLSPLDSLKGETLQDATTYQTKGLKYGMSKDVVFNSWAASGFSMVMQVWNMAQRVNGDVTGKSIADEFAATNGTEPVFGGPPLNCNGAPEPYVSVCSPIVAVTVWDGQKLNAVTDSFTGIGLVAGTKIRAS